MKKSLSILLAILLIIMASAIVYLMIINNQKPDRKPVKIIKSVYAEKVTNQEIPIIIKANGTLFAKNKIEIFSEVQGVLKPSSKEFRAGNLYHKGEIILSINSEEHYANLQAQKSNLYNNITSIMPDLRLDFPEEYQKWENYLKRFDFDKTTPKLPEPSSDKEKFFISGRNIYTSYYNVKNMEVRLNKYIIRAPFSGVLTEALVNPGSLVRQGQKLGEFINPSVYEMEVAINAQYLELLQKGNTVKLTNLDQTKTWEGTVVRVNGRIDQSTQTVKAYIQVSGDDLREGFYLEAHLKAKSEKNAIEIPRNLLVNNQSVFVVQDSVIDLVNINPVYFKDKSVIVKGLKNGDLLMSKPIPGAYPGMVVKIVDTQNK